MNVEHACIDMNLNAAQDGMHAGKPPPPPAVETTPCFEGGSDCTDYESRFSPCTVYTYVIITSSHHPLTPQGQVAWLLVLYVVFFPEPRLLQNFT